MKVVIFLALFAAAYAQLKEIPIIRQINILNPDGSYNWAYETGNKIFAEEQGVVKSNEIISAQGQYQFTSPEGLTFRTAYVADENGYQPQGDHLPTPPPVPDQILRALKWLEQNPEKK